MSIDYGKMSCIGILGGTFNPVHKGHIMMAKEAYEQTLDMEKLVIMPNNLPAYKDNKCIVDNKHRLNMLKLAFGDMDFALISDMEIKRGGITYTVDTLRELKKINNNMKIYYIIGADSLYSFTKWYEYKEIFSLCTLLVFIRETGIDDMKKCAEEYIQKYNANIKFLLCREVKASSTDIRNELASGRKPYELLPEKVIGYIYENKLYM